MCLKTKFLVFGIVVCSSGSSGLPREPPIWAWSGSSHFDFGKTLGTRFAADIEQRHVRDPDMAAWLEPWARTPEGQQVVSAFLTTHVHLFPEFIEEVWWILFMRANSTTISHGVATGCCASYTLQNTPCIMQILSRF